MATAPDASGVPSVGCRACQWSLPLHALDDAAQRFQSMCVETVYNAADTPRPCFSPASHSPAIACVPFVGVLLLCSRCDEQLVLA